MGKHEKWRKVAKRARRKRIRQSLAKIRHEKEEEEQRRREQSPTYLQLLQKYEEEEAFQEEEEARLRAEAEQRWLKIEEEAQRQWRELQKKLEEAREERIRQNLLIKLEWEKEQKRLKELKEAKEREREENEKRQQQLRDEIENFIANGGDTPEHLKVSVEMNPNKPVCPFFQKTSACRFRDSCSRNHIKPGVSRILLIPNFYSHYSLEQTENEYDDSSLEFENHETYSHFKDFFFDVLPEMERFGRIRQFKVCCNRESHLRGNVYVEYSTTREAVKSFQVFNGRWYGGRQLSVEFCNIESWKSAICGLHSRKKCPKGSSCNFLHVFPNPQNMFHLADRDEHRTPSRSISRSETEERNWRWSESPERLEYTTSEKRREEKHTRNGCSSKRRSQETSHSRSSKSRKRSRSRNRRENKSNRKKSKHH
ncbi:U2 small nuclear ribonucleoprotein auxiliary factor 35 kDa subunit-related protein 2 [Tribolium castaneum]|uniref:U2 small nuclear ribonucleoprotein auxiliary factor 35 kDa subunit-related protein 2-like Protein n=1 Tax=Tribolium castaneum TaxID=7070 RepID=D6WKS3_TRICA|nr:PREDICTED: U2 small nuclear ribonucleoprotein auxiliary factor 35 kDa subunit-related protein 2 [Tribolium castaneum]EFA02987.2 U2 small nuclear ribonucleoprotein auxiliary factor 35 kDa subunit-related protein 2-like Protein [Tribolium castaneum]|eukprot:XP_008200499.1 PREDICTED: U2 small nuclear ribonucleoprotein auxiliary factor 35 kDa subunit-related protein 2 [Tribolium castaneum]